MIDHTPPEGAVQRATFLPWDRLVELNRFGNYVYDAWGRRPYLVGSALVRANYRDVDVRLILSDEEFATHFGRIERPRWKNSRWNAHCIAWTHFGQSITGLVIDFQIDQQTQANADHDARGSRTGPAAVTSPADFLASEDGQTLVEAAHAALLEHVQTPGEYPHDAKGVTSNRATAMHGARLALLAILSASKPCPTCGGSGWTQRTREGRRIPATDPANDPPGPPGRPRSPCPSCQGTGTVPILPIPEGAR